MKGLLQSKKFKKNLSKWLIMYLLCMGLFTTMVTYSKYLSKMLNSEDEARVSKFNINLMYCADEKCDNSEMNSYPLKKYRPSGEIYYYFAVDTSKLEVNAELYLTTRVLDNHFKLKEVSEITDQGITKVSDNNGLVDTTSITTNVTIGDTKLRKYRVTVVYNESIVDYNREGCSSTTSNCKVINGVVRENATDLPKYIFDESKQYNVLEIGYSLSQIK